MKKPPTSKNTLLALEGAKLGAVPLARRSLSASMAAIVFSPIACTQKQSQDAPPHGQGMWPSFIG